MFFASLSPRSPKNRVSTRLHRSPGFFAGLAVGVAAIALTARMAPAVTTGNLLTDPGFETQPLTSYVNVLAPPYLTNIWGDEVSTIVGATGGVSPAGGVKMLSMTTDGLVATQTFQVVDVSAFSAPINAGLATADLSALFNVDKNLAAAKAEVSLQFYDSSHTIIGGSGVGVLTLDANPATWEQISANGVAVPANTNYLLAQVLYINSTMNDAAGVNQPGFVDDAKLTLTTTPEPASLGLFALAALGMLRVRRAR
jgi:PEP-CTERM motif